MENKDIRNHLDAKQEWEIYKHLIEDARIKRKANLIKFVATLAFVGSLSIAFHSYIPYLFLVLLLL